MARVYRAQIAVGADTAFPRDRVTLTPHFNDSSDGNAQTLATDLADKMNVFHASTREVVVKVYDAQKPKPNPPMATATRSAGLFPASPTNRDIALCLSYYATTNAPRHRGRIYIPAFWFSTGSIGVRPTNAQMQAIEQFVTMFATSGPSSVVWCVYSRKDQVARNVTNWWVDDEWDTQRRRGLRPSTRNTGTTPG
jgi:hypothetical protein